MRRYQGHDMPLLAHMLNLREPAFEQAQQHDVSHPPPSPVVASHPSPDPMPSPPRQSSPPPIPFGPAPTSGVVSTDPIPDIPSSFRPSEPVLETITSPFRDDDTGGGSFHASLLALFPICLQRIDTLESKLKATKILHRDTVVLFAKRIKKLKSKLKTKKRKLVLSDSENEEEARQSKELDALLDLANAALHEPSLSTTPSKPANPEQTLEQEISSTTLDAVLTLSQSKAGARAATIIYKRLKKQKSLSGLDFTDADIPAGGVDSAGGLTSAGISVTAGPTVPAEPSSPLTDPSKGKAVATPSLPVTAPTDKELADQQAAILEAERQELLEQELKQNIDAEQVYLDILMVELMNRRRKAIAKIKAKAKREKPMTPAQQKELMRTFVKNQKLQETTYVSAGATIAAGDPIPTETFSVSVASSIPAATPIAAGVSTTASASRSASEASVPIIELLDSPPKDTSLPLDPKIKEQDEPLSKSSRKKSIARKRTLPSLSKPKSDALPFDEDDPKAAFKRAVGIVKRFSTLRELMYWAGRADLMVLYGLVSDKYKIERATDKKYPLTPETLQRMLNHGLEIDRDPSGNDLTTAIQLIQSLLNQLNPSA
nr:hypothetical protein [Tanacetum cinerariifolium]